MPEQQLIFIFLWNNVVDLLQPRCVYVLSTHLHYWPIQLMARQLSLFSQDLGYAQSSRMLLQKAICELMYNFMWQIILDTSKRNMRVVSVHIIYVFSIHSISLPSIANRLCS